MSKKNGTTTSLDSKCKDNEEFFSHPSHPDHKMTLLQHEEPKKEKIKYCNGCNEVMCFPGYACHECKFYLHKSCAELPPNIQHRLHPHPLTCSLTDKAIICDGCRDLYRSGFIFNCSWCGFNLDAKCASKQDQEHHQTFKELPLFPFYHKHALKLCNVRKSRDMIDCLCCTQIISGSAYCCLQCQFFIHESCTEIPKEVDHPFHPQHILVFQNMDDNRNCAVCLLSISNSSTSSTSSPSIHGIGISCKECDFNLHVSCANPNRWASPLKHNCHEHNMFYFVENETEDRRLECNKCHKRFSNKAFYRCVECNFNLHLECIPIPSVVTVTQKHHHPLTLIDSVKEDNPLIQYLMDSNDKVDYSMEYYCDVCETPGNPRRHAYCCKECIYIAHVECIICEEQEGLASKEKGRKDTILHFFHHHQLKLRFFFDTTSFCCWCYKGIYGPGYHCIDCKFFIHDLCCMEISPQLQLPFHPHPLHFKFNFTECRACRKSPEPIGSMFLSCEECNFDLHRECATSTMKLSLKHDCHNHNLYFAFDLKNKEDNVLYCNKCHDTGDYFYCCTECDINFHFECIPLPCVLKLKSHEHPLTLTYSPNFEDSFLARIVSYFNEVRCDICKAGYLIAGHPIFLCKECNYFKSFVHIECTISEDDTAVEVLEYLNPRPEKEQRSSTEDHYCSEKRETLALELETLEEKHVNKESEASLEQKISDMNNVDADHDQERKEANDRLLSSLDKSENAKDETAEVQAKKIEEDHEDCVIV